MAALDVAVTPALRQTLRRVLADRTVVLVTHDALDALLLADRVVVIEDGAVVEQGPRAEVLAQPRSAFAARIAGLNMVTGTWRDDVVLTPDGLRVAGRSSTPAPAPGDAGRRGVPAHRRLGLPRAAGRQPAQRPRGDGHRPRAATAAGSGSAAAELSADITPQAAADLDLAPGCPRLLRRQGDRGLRLRDLT